MKSLRARNIMSVCMLIAVCAAVAWTQARKPPTVQRQVEGTRPRLVLLIVVDQFRYDYLTRFGDLFGARGLGRLTRRGADWTHANFDHVPTFTAPGHAVFMTGAWPSQTGIIANEWYEQDTGKKEKSITDDGVMAVGSKDGEQGNSPRRLLCSNVGDELRLADRSLSKAIG